MIRRIQICILCGILTVCGESLIAQENPCREPGVVVSPTPENFLDQLLLNTTVDEFTSFSDCFISFPTTNPIITFIPITSGEGTLVQINRYKDDDRGETNPGSIDKGGDPYTLKFENESFKYGVGIRFRNPGVFQLAVAGAGDYNGVYFITITSEAPVNWVRDLTYTSFSENQLLLEWSVSHQEDVSGYELQQMLPETESFSTIDRIRYQENGTLQVDYSIVTSMPKQGAYYRIKQLDHAGTYDYSNVIFVPGSDGGTQQFAVFPNPASDYARLSLPEDISSVDLVNSAGQVVSRTPAPEARREGLDVRTVPAGVYFVRPVGGANGGRPQRLVVAH